MRADGARAGLVGLLLLAVACGRSDPPHLKASALPADAAAGAFRFQLRNVGGRPLELDGVAPACGCGVTSPVPASLAPGASTIVDVQCRGGQPAGPTERALRVRSSDPRMPTTVLSAVLPVRPSVPDPTAVYFGYVRVGESAVRDVVLPPTVALDALPASPRPELALERLPTRPDGARGIRIRFTPQAPGVLRATLDLGPAAGTLPVVAVAHDGILALPAELGAGADLPTVVLMATGDEPLAIAGVEYPPGVVGEIRTVVPGRQLRLVLRGSAGAGGVIRVRRNGGGAPLAIPIVGPATTTAPRA